jgi:hypothetical protein
VAAFINLLLIGARPVLSYRGTIVTLNLRSVQALTVIDRGEACCSSGRHGESASFPDPALARKNRPSMRKLIAFDEDTFDKLKQLGRDRMATFQELADEAFADLLKKHGIPIDLKDALRKSARLGKQPGKQPDKQVGARVKAEAKTDAPPRASSKTGASSKKRKTD